MKKTKDIKPITYGDLTVSNFCALEALVNILQRNKFIDETEYIEEVRKMSMAYYSDAS